MTTTSKSISTPITTPLATATQTKTIAKPAVNAAPPALPKVKAPTVKKVAVKPKVAKTAKVSAEPAAKSAPIAVTKATAEKPLKVKKPKMVRDSLTIPKLEYAVLEVLKLRAVKLGRPVKKTEVIRAGVKALAAMPDAAFLAALKAVPSLKTGRPSNK